MTENKMNTGKRFDEEFKREAARLASQAGKTDAQVASDLGAARVGGPTVALFETPSLNTLDHSRLLPGDMAFRPGGIYVLAYRSWIEADPTVGRVVTTTVPSPEGAWSETPMRLVRWEVLGP